MFNLKSFIQKWNTRISLKSRTFIIYNVIGPPINLHKEVDYIFLDLNSKISYYYLRLP